MSLEAIQEKLDKGEELTAEETKEVMSSANTEGQNALSSGDEGKEKDEVEYEDIDEEVGEEGKDKGASAKKDDNAKPGEKGNEDTSAQAEKDQKAKDEAAKAEEERVKAEAEKNAKPEETLKEKLERELGKPDNQEDLTDYSEREKGLFYSLKTERKKRQDAQADLDAFKFKGIKDSRAKEEAEKIKKDADQAIEETLEEAFKGKDAEDFISITEMKKALKPLLLQKEAPASKEEQTASYNNQVFLRIAETSARDVLESRRVKDPDLPDFDKVMALGPDIFEGNEAYEKELSEALKANRNPALTCYELIRKDPKFSALYGKPAKKEEKPPAKKEPDKETLDKINKNDKKPVTSGAHGGGGGGSEELEGYTLEKLNAMTPMEFRQVPKHIRDKFLKGY